jgi:hypothetical protein
MHKEPLTDAQFSLKALKWSYITAFALIILLAILAQCTIQYALYREIQSRQAASYLSRQEVRSERIGRDMILLLVPVNHKSVIAEMQADLSQEDTDRTAFATTLAAYYPSFADIDGGHGHALKVYNAIRTNALAMIAIAQETPAQQKKDFAKDHAFASAIFYAQPEQLKNLQDAQRIVEDDTDSYIHLIQQIELGLFSLTVLVLLYESLFVLRPALKRFAEADQKERVTPRIQAISPEAQSI